MNWETQLVCYSREGKRLRNIGASGAYPQFALSPDEKTAALTVNVPPGRVTDLRIWLLRLDTGVISKYDFGDVSELRIRFGPRILAVLSLRRSQWMV